MLIGIVPIVCTVMTEKEFGLIERHVCGVCVYWSICGSVGVWSVCDVCVPACMCVFCKTSVCVGSDELSEMLK